MHSLDYYIGAMTVECESSHGGGGHTHTHTHIPGTRSLMTLNTQTMESRPAAHRAVRVTLDMAAGGAKSIIP